MSIDPTSGPKDVLAALRDGRIQGSEKRLRASAQLMEGVFYQQLFKAMRDTIPEGGAISGSQGQEMFEGLLDERMSEAAATRAEGGLGEALYRHFSRHLEIEPPAGSAGDRVGDDSGVEGGEADGEDGGAGDPSVGAARP